jgi:hypothetical protein
VRIDTSSISLQPFDVLVAELRSALSWHCAVQILLSNVTKSTLRCVSSICSCVFGWRIYGWHRRVSCLESQHLVLGWCRMVQKAWRLVNLLLGHSGGHIWIVDVLEMKILLLGVLWSHWRYAFTFHLLLLNHIGCYLFRRIWSILILSDWISSKAVTSWSKFLQRVFSTLSLGFH